MDTQTAGASYERSLGRSTRKANGVYYSPEPLVTYMVEATVGELLSRCESAEQALALRVYDPACGAGYFLVAAFRRIRDWLQTRGTELTPGLLRAIQEGCLFGRDVDRAALEVARLELPFANLTAENSLRARDGRRFHAVLGNPPYGVDTGSKGDSSRLFIEHALSSLEPGGLHSFIVPKPLLYSSTWHATLARLMPGILELVDCGAAWADVKLEQVIYVYAA
ncbi:MAG: N-6 DNA methylase, partial [Deltaproteobacteria bacterium]|nr:N-6 DNA methylase [Deltaproteobacteria bacterium]